MWWRRSPRRLCQHPAEWQSNGRLGQVWNVTPAHCSVSKSAQGFQCGVARWSGALSCLTSTLLAPCTFILWQVSWGWRCQIGVRVPFPAFKISYLFLWLCGSFHGLLIWFAEAYLLSHISLDFTTQEGPPSFSMSYLYYFFFRTCYFPELRV